MITGHRSQRMHSLSGFEARQMPAEMIGMEQSRAMKLRVAIMLLLTAMDEFELEVRIECVNCEGEGEDGG